MLNGEVSTDGLTGDHEADIRAFDAHERPCFDIEIHGAFADLELLIYRGAGIVHSHAEGSAKADARDIDGDGSGERARDSRGRYDECTFAARDAHEFVCSVAERQGAVCEHHANYRG